MKYVLLIIQNNFHSGFSQYLITILANEFSANYPRTHDLKKYLENVRIRLF